MTLKDKLKEIIDNNLSSLSELAEYLGITYQSLSNKMNGRSDFTRKEIQRIADLYRLSSEEVFITFFSDDID